MYLILTQINYLGLMKMMSIIETIFIGAALAVIWFWVAILFRITSPGKGFKEWLVFVMPQGIVVAVALKFLGIY